MYNKIIISVLVLCFANIGSALWCYECVSTEPGCSTPFNWYFHWTTVCPEDDDVCVKITESKGAETIITRACLSTIQGIRTDIPADHYEGCRAAAVDVKLGHYVNNSIKELDIYRNHYDETEFCFCFLDHRCNDSTNNMPSFIILSIGAISLLLSSIF